MKTIKDSVVLVIEIHNKKLDETMFFEISLVIFLIVSKDIHIKLI